MSRLTAADAWRANDEYQFSCGPAAVCAVLDMTPGELRPHLGSFESKGYTNPTLMAEILDNLHVPFRRVYERRGDEIGNVQWPALGVVRIQWGGPWTKPGVPMRVRYRQTHWIGTRQVVVGQIEVFDINALGARGYESGWIPRPLWRDRLVPLITSDIPKASGEWWPTHCWELDLSKWSKDGE